MSMLDYLCCCGPQTRPSSDTSAGMSRSTNVAAEPKSPSFISSFFKYLWDQKAKVLGGIFCIGTATLLSPLVGPTVVGSIVGGMFVGLFALGGGLIGNAIGGSCGYACEMTRARGRNR